MNKNYCYFKLTNSLDISRIITIGHPLVNRNIHFTRYLEKGYKISSHFKIASWSAKIRFPNYVRLGVNILKNQKNYSLPLGAQPSASSQVKIMSRIDKNRVLNSFRLGENKLNACSNPNELGPDRCQFTKGNYYSQKKSSNRTSTVKIKTKLVAPARKSNNEDWINESVSKVVPHMSPKPRPSRSL